MWCQNNVRKITLCLESSSTVGVNEFYPDHYMAEKKKKDQFENYFHSERIVGKYRQVRNKKRLCKGKIICSNNGFSIYI